MILQPMGRQWMVPLLYLLIQGVDAPVALLSGYAYDRFGVKLLTYPFMLSVLPPLLTIADAGLPGLIAASISFGAVLGMQESTYRAAVSEFTPIPSRGTAYGIFNTAYGIGLLLSGLIYGLFIDLKASPASTLPFIVLMQSSAVIVLMKTRVKAERSPKIIRDNSSERPSSEGK
jgi:predicted MFS family arabinose efflux permease